MKRLLPFLLCALPLWATPKTANLAQTIHVDNRTTAAQAIHVDQRFVLQETVTVHYDSVYLNWTSSATGDVIKYNVYRGATSGGPYTLIGSNTATTYTDSTVLINNTYYYVVTAVAPSCPNSGNPCGESSYSNESKAVMP